MPVQTIRPDRRSRASAALFGDRVVRPPWMFRLVNMIRHFGFDALVLIPVLLAGWWWATGPGGIVLTQYANEAGDGVDQWIVNHHISEYYPSAMALFPCLVLLRSGRRARAMRIVTTQRKDGTKVRSKVAGSTISTSPPPAFGMFITAVALIVLYFVPGPLVGKFGPSVVAAVWVLILRYVLFSLTDERVRTGAGYRPPVRAVLSGNRRRHIRRCATAPVGGAVEAARARTVFTEALDRFGGRGDRAMRGWVAATAVDYELRINALGHAERLVSGFAEDPLLTARPEVLAAEALFHRAVGDYAGAVDLLRQAAAVPGSRTPRLVSTVSEDCSALEAYSRLHGPRTEESSDDPARDSVPSETWRLVWSRQHAAALGRSLACLRRRAGRDLESVLEDALRIMAVVYALRVPLGFADMSRAEAAQLDVVRTETEEFIGDLLAEQQCYLAAASTYLSAGQALTESGWRSRRALVQAKAAVNALRAGTLTAAREALALSMLQHSLRALEYSRGHLIDTTHRFSLIDANGGFYGDVFEALAAVSFHPDRAAELGLWLMEETHRNSLADTLRAEPSTADDQDLQESIKQYKDAASQRRVTLEDEGNTADQLRDFTGSSGPMSDLAKDLEDKYSRFFARTLVPELVELGSVLDRLGDRFAAYYHCVAVETGWAVTTVTVAHGSIDLHRTLVPTPDRDPRDIAGVRKPGGVLAAFDSGDAERITDVHRYGDITDEVWRELALALVPPELDAVLRARPGSNPAVLLIVPDGPLSLVPFAGLPLSDGTRLVDRAVTVMMPNLNLLPDDGGDGGGMDPGRGRRRAVLDCGPTEFENEYRSALRDAGSPVGEVETDFTRDGADLVDRLSRDHDYQLAAISNHGVTAQHATKRGILLTGGAFVTVNQAFGISWPRNVVLHACWATHITVSTRGEPIGLPTACLFGGAESVLGGQAPVGNDIVDPGARVFGQASVAALGGQHLAIALREAIQARRAASGDASAPPADWANLTVWTTRPPAAAAARPPRATSATESRGKLWTTPDSERAKEADAFIDLRRIAVKELFGDSKREAARRTLAMPWPEPLTRAVAEALANAPRAVTCSIDLAPVVDGGHLIRRLGLLSRPVRQRAAGRYTVLRDAEESEGIADVVFPDGSCLRTTLPLAGALVAAETIAYGLGDREVRADHLGYGLLSEPTTAVSRGLAEAGESDAFGEFCMKAFGRRLKRPKDLKGIPIGLRRTFQRPGIPPKPQARVPRRPQAGDAIMAAVHKIGESDGRPIGTLEMVAAMRPDLANSDKLPPVTATRPHHPEYDGGALRRTIGPFKPVAVTRDLGRALESAERRAALRGSTVVDADDLLAGIRGEAASEGAQRLTAVASADPTPPTKETRSLPPVLLKTTAPELLGLLALGGAVLAGAGLLKLMRFTAGITFFGLISLTVGLHDDGDAPANNDVVLQDGSSIITTVDLSDGKNVPATLLGSMDSFYADPVIKGTMNLIKWTFSKSGPPSSLSDLYIYAVMPPGGAAANATVEKVDYGTSEYPVTVYCPHSSSALVCFGIARIPGGPHPAGLPWNGEIFSQPPISSAGAMVFAQHADGVTVDPAEITARQPLYSTPTWGYALDVVDANADTLIRPLSPVLPAGRSHQLPIFGVAVAGSAGQKVEVLPFGLLELYADSLTAISAGAPSGSSPYIGVELADASSTQSGAGASPVVLAEVTIGGPADIAGLAQGDEIVSIGGHAPASSADAKQMIDSYHPGDSVAVIVIRAGHQLDLTVRMGYV